MSPKPIALAAATVYLIDMRRNWIVASLLLSACGIDPLPAGNEGQPMIEAAPLALDPGSTPVRIGESGAAFDACTIRAVVTEAGVPVRAAPFDEGAIVARVANGTRLYVCTRSLDQRWLGTVVVPAGDGRDGCGLQLRVDRARAYEGPCVSGWVPRAAVRLTAN